MSLRFIIILDLTADTPLAQTLRHESNLGARLDSLGAPIVSVSEAQNGVATALAAAETHGADKIVLVTGDQIFLDPSVVENALARFASQPWDYLTQWEHVRLPVGVGMRAYAPSLVQRAAKEGVTLLADLPNWVADNHTTVTARYDDHAYVPFLESRLDTRARPALTSQVKVGARGSQWLLAGAQALAQLSAGALDYEPTDADGRAPAVDGRGMRAPYGFETGICGRFPTYVMLDVTNRCNAACVHCPQSVGFPGVEKTTFAPLEKIERLLSECDGEQVDFLRITADGEPLLHPDIYDIIALAKRTDIKSVGLTTNGSAMNVDNAGKLLDAGLDVIDVSLDAASEESFAKIRVGLSYQRTIENLKTLIRLRNARHHHLKVMVSFVKQPDNAHEAAAFKELWEPVVDMVLFRDFHTNVNATPEAQKGGEETKDRRWPCPHVFRRTILGYDGNIKFCPIDWQSGSVLEPYGEEPIDALWQGDTYHALRMHHLNDSYPADSFCGPCGDWRATPWALGYEKVIARLRT